MIMSDEGESFKKQPKEFDPAQIRKFGATVG